jgi:hypothetical protein
MIRASTNTIAMEAISEENSGDEDEKTIKAMTEIS